MDIKLENRAAPFSGLKEQPADALLSLIALYGDDPRPEKIDLGVGVYRNDDGFTPVLDSVKAAEQALIEKQDTKAYLGAEGDVHFTGLLAEMVFGRSVLDKRPMMGLQTPGGTAALRLGAELLASANPDARVWLGTPGWPNHLSIFRDAGMRIETFPYYDVKTMQIDIDGMYEGLKQAQPGDIVLLQVCCHNPSGSAFDREQWETLAAFLAERGLLPFLDLAYQGFGDGLKDDVLGVGIMASAVPDLLLAYSCSKNFGMYRDRVGALWVLGDDRQSIDLVGANVLALARSLWSMPPDHGAAVVRMILETPTLREQWEQELSAMRVRLSSLRASLASIDPLLAPLERQQGMFSLLPLSPEAVQDIRRKHGIFMPESGRINLAGLQAETIERFAKLVLPYIAVSAA